MLQRYVSKELTHFVGRCKCRTGRKLFSMGLGLQEDLKSGNFSKELRQEFADNCYPICQNVTIRVKEGHVPWEIHQDMWGIHDEDGRILYVIKKEGNSLNTHYGGCKCKESDQYALLVKILKSGKLKPDKDYVCSSIHGLPAAMVQISPFEKFSSGEMYKLECVCFCDIPVPDLTLHMGKYSKFGLAFSKSFLIKKGANPVFYVAKESSVLDIAPDIPVGDLECRLKNRKTTLSEHLESIYAVYSRGDLFSRMVKELHGFLKKINDLPCTDAAEVQCISNCLKYHLISFVKTYEEGMDDNNVKNYYMEREWRVPGHVKFDLGDVCRIILPESCAKQFRLDFPCYNGQLTFAEFCGSD